MEISAGAKIRNKAHVKRLVKIGAQADIGARTTIDRESQIETQALLQPDVLIGQKNQIGGLGRALVSLLQPCATCGRAAALDRPILRARSGV